MRQTELLCTYFGVVCDDDGVLLRYFQGSFNQLGETLGVLLLLFFFLQRSSQQLPVVHLRINTYEPACAG